ncbi:MULTISPECIES: hypothetical protein [Acinetobacter]|uniref:Lipoprotein n=1 Tax=Acinetobacter pittii ANC 4050 TaxID=1217691 RepID=R8YP43_ACIPI|nr:MULTISPECIES: hypothetical protein [Acinetobacter]EOQ71190.1 hypothetical protein F931_00249 [Acinetobacter pittii ANC 4050]
MEKHKNLIPIFLTILLASCHVPSYAKDVHQKADELTLAGYIAKGAQSAYRAFFVRKISMHLHVTAGLERDTFGCAGDLLRLSANPFQLRHPHLAVNGEAPNLQKERIHNA